MKKISLLLSAIFAFTVLFAGVNPFTISFGSGGGVTGSYTIYSIGSDGKIYKQKKMGANLNGGREELAMLKKKQVKKLDKMIAAVNFPSLNINQPGNMSSMVDLNQGGKDYHAAWSIEKATSGNAALDALYKQLNSLIPKK